MTIPPLSSSEDESARNQPGYDGKRAASVGSEPSAARSSERVQEDFLAYRIGFWDGFMASDEGWNGEYPTKPERDAWLNERSNAYAREMVAKEALSVATASPESLGVSQEDPTPSDPSTAWRGIESAPRDGSWFLAVCWTHGHPSVRQVHFADEFDRLPINEHVPGMWPTVPTHWMPLPGAPS